MLNSVGVTFRVDAQTPEFFVAQLMSEAAHWVIALMPPATRGGSANVSVLGRL
jgi:hypothetical protein